MGSGNSTPAKVTPTNPIVKQLFHAAENDIENKDITSAVEAYKKAEAITANQKVIEYIHYKLSTLLPSKENDLRDAGQTTNEPPIKIEKAQDVTKQFNELFEAFKTNVASPATYNDAVENIDRIIQIDPRQVKSIGTYFQNLMSDIVCQTDLFQGIDTDQTDYIKENIMILLKDLAFVNFQNNLSIGLKISSGTHKQMVDAITHHIKWMRASESKGISFTQLYFFTDYILDILKLMSTTSSFVEKLNLSGTAMDVISECLALNISGAAGTLSKNICAGILKVAKEQIHGSFSKKTLSKLIQYKALTKTIGQLLIHHQNDNTPPSSLTLTQTNAYEIFFEELDYAHSHKLDWKIYIQLLNDLFEVFKATPKGNVAMRLKLIQGDAAKNHKGLYHFSTFAKFSFMVERLEKRNWRIRETALRVALKLWWVVHNDECNTEIFDALQIIILSYEPRLKKEHVVVKHIFQQELYKKVLNSIATRAMDQKKLAKETANLVGDFGNDLNNALKEMVDEQKNDAGNVARNDAIKVLEKNIDDIADDMEGDGDSNNSSLYLKIQANRIRGDKAKAKGDYRDAIRIYLKWENDAIEMNDGNKNCADLMRVFVTLGELYELQGEYEMSMEYLKKALPMQVKEFGTEEHVDIGKTYGSMGRTCSSMGEYEQAMEYCMKSLKIRLKVLDKGHVDVGGSYHKIGSVCDDQGKYDTALEYYNKALDICRNKLGEDHPRVAGTYNNMAAVYYNQGKYETALEYYNKALDINKNKLGKDHPDVASTYNNMAGLFYNQGKYDAALEYYNKALGIRINKLGEDHPDVAGTYNNMAGVYQNQDKYEVALEYFKKALDIQINKLGEDHPSVAMTHYNMAIVYYNQGKYGEALGYYNKALTIYINKLGEDHPETKQTQNNIQICKNLIKGEEEQKD